MSRYAELSIDDFLDALAGRTPTPGGGAVAATMGALAASLGRMVAAYSGGSKAPEPLRRRFADLGHELRALDELQRALITQDGEAYRSMTEAARAARNDPNAAPAHRKAVLAAIGVPMEVAAIAARTLGLLDDVREHVSTYMISDLAVAAIAAHAAAEAAGYMVRVNLGSVDDHATRDRIADDLRKVLQRAEAQRDSIASFVAARLEPEA